VLTAPVIATKINAAINAPSMAVAICDQYSRPMRDFISMGT
jgi:hypothetical protein